MRVTAGRRAWTTVLPLVTVLTLALQVSRVAAAESDRGMTWQLTIPISFTSGESFSGDGGTSIDVNDDVGWGFGFGYNLDERWMLGVDITWLSANYDASIATDFDGDQIADDSIDVSGTLDASNLQFVGQFNLFPKRWTPFARGSFGWTWVDSNIPSGPATGTCYWDPWFGYVCTTWQPTYEDTSFAYGLAAGVRGDVNEKFFLEASYNVLWIDFSKSGSQAFDGVRFNIGWVF